VREMNKLADKITEVSRQRVHSDRILRSDLKRG
jgi:hypothetical protein